jgi:diamine N-acetyltransferase
MGNDSGHEMVCEECDPEQQEDSLVLVPVTLDNYQQCVDLCVAPEQERFVGTVAEAIADAHFNPHWRMSAIVLRRRIKETADVIVGFMAYHRDPQRNLVIRLRRFLVDCHYQGRGYGGRALALWIRCLRRLEDASLVELSTQKDNAGAISVYEKKGFLFRTAIGDVLVGELSLL